MSAMGADFRDLGNTGRPDITATALAGETFPLFRNQGKGSFADAGYTSRLGVLSRLYSGWGIGLSITQFVSQTAGIAFRYGWQDADDVAVEQVASVQYLSYAGSFRPKDVWGVGVGWGRPSSDLDDEYVAEAFYRIQLTRNMQVTPDVQIIANPSNAPDDDILAVFGVRLRTAF